MIELFLSSLLKSDITLKIVKSITYQYLGLFVFLVLTEVVLGPF